MLMAKFYVAGSEYISIKLSKAHGEVPQVCAPLHSTWSKEDIKKNMKQITNVEGLDNIEVSFLIHLTMLFKWKSFTLQVTKSYTLS